MRKIRILIVCLVALVLLYSSAGAQVIPAGQAVTLSSIQRLIEQVATFLITVALVIAVIYIIWSGIKYMMAGDDSSKATSAKEQLKSAVIGAFIVLAVGVILATIRYIVQYQSFGF